MAQPAAEVRSPLEPVLHHRRPRRDRGFEAASATSQTLVGPRRRVEAAKPSRPARRRRSRGSPSRVAGRRRCRPPAHPRPASPAPGARSAPARPEGNASGAAAGRRWRSRPRAAPGSTRAATAARSRRDVGQPRTAGGTGSSPAGRRRPRDRDGEQPDHGPGLGRHRRRDGPPDRWAPARRSEGRGGRRRGGHRDEDRGPARATRTSRAPASMASRPTSSTASADVRRHPPGTQRQVGRREGHGPADDRGQREAGSSPRRPLSPPIPADGDEQHRVDAHSPMTSRR